MMVQFFNSPAVCIVMLHRRVYYIGSYPVAMVSGYSQNISQLLNIY